MADLANEAQRRRAIAWAIATSTNWCGPSYRYADPHLLTLLKAFSEA